jgi:hypothetical protein
MLREILAKIFCHCLNRGLDGEELGATETIPGAQFPETLPERPEIRRRRRIFRPASVPAIDLIKVHARADILFAVHETMKMPCETTLTLRNTHPHGTEKKREHSAHQIMKTPISFLMISDIICESESEKADLVKADLKDEFFSIGE